MVDENDIPFLEDEDLIPAGLLEATCYTEGLDPAHCRNCPNPWVCQDLLAEFEQVQGCLLGLSEWRCQLCRTGQPQGSKCSSSLECYLRQELIDTKDMYTREYYEYMRARYYLEEHIPLDNSLGAMI